MESNEEEVSEPPLPRPVVYEEDEDPDCPFQLTIGDELPNFHLPTQKVGESIYFDSTRGEYLVIVAFPLCFIPRSSSEAIALQENLQRLSEIGCGVLGITTESPYILAQWTTMRRCLGGTGELQYPVCSDQTGRVLKKLGLWYEGKGTALRGVVIISPEGRIIHIAKNAPEVTRSVEEIIRTINAHQTPPAEERPQKEVSYGKHRF